MLKLTKLESGDESFSIEPSLSGAVAGTIAGARLGSVVPGAGTTVCALVGGFLGLILGPPSIDEG